MRSCDGDGDLVMIKILGHYSWEEEAGGEKSKVEEQHWEEKSVGWLLRYLK